MRGQHDLSGGNGRHRAGEVRRPNASLLARIVVSGLLALSVGCVAMLPAQGQDAGDALSLEGMPTAPGLVTNRLDLGLSLVQPGVTPTTGDLRLSITPPAEASAGAPTIHASEPPADPPAPTGRDVPVAQPVDLEQIVSVPQQPDTPASVPDDGPIAPMDEGRLELNPHWSVREVSGRVLGRGGLDEPWLPVATGQVLVPPMYLWTGPMSTMRLRRAGDLVDDTIDVAPNTQLFIGAVPDGINLTHVRHTIGEVYFVVQPDLPRAFRVDTPYLAAVVKGTEFSSVVDDQGAAIGVAEGVVGVSAAGSGSQADVAAGSVGEVSGRSGTVGVAAAGQASTGAGQAAGASAAAAAGAGSACSRRI